MELLSEPSDQALAAITQRNLRALLVTRSQLQALAPLIAALADHVGRELAEVLLHGCYVRVRSLSAQAYVLRRIGATRLPSPLGADSAGTGPNAPAAAPVWPLSIELEPPQPGAEPPPPLSAAEVSNANPFDDQAAYDASGHDELQRYQAELAVYGRPPGMPLWETVAAVWRRHVALTWAGQNLLATHGISQLVDGLQDEAKLQEQLGFIETLDQAAPSLGPMRAPPAAMPAADTHLAPSADAPATALAPAYASHALPALQAVGSLPGAAASLQQPAEFAALRAALPQADAAAGAAFGAGAAQQQQRFGQPQDWQGSGQVPPMQQQQGQGPGQVPPMQQQEWQGPGQPLPMQQQFWQPQQQHPMYPGGPPAGMQPQPSLTLPHPSPFQAGAAAAQGNTCVWRPGGQQAHQQPNGTLHADPSLQLPCPAVAASGAEVSWADGALALHDSGGSPQFFELVVTGVLPGTTDGQLAALFRGMSYCSMAYARVVGPGRGIVKFKDRHDRDAAYSEVNGSRFAGNMLGTNMPAGEEPPRLACLYVSNLPSGFRKPAVLQFFRERYPSAQSVRALGNTWQSAGRRDGSCFVRFPSAEERDIALREMHGASFEGGPIRAEKPRGELLRSGQRGLDVAVQRQKPADEAPAGTPAAAAAAAAAAVPAAAAQPQCPNPSGSAAMPAQQVQQAQAGGGDLFPLFVVNVGDAMSEAELLSYFRERYPSAASATLRRGYATVRFSSDEERLQANKDMNDHVLPGGRKIGTGLPSGTLPKALSTAGAAASAVAQPAHAELSPRAAAAATAADKVEGLLAAQQPEQAPAQQVPQDRLPTQQQPGQQLPSLLAPLHVPGPQVLLQAPPEDQHSAPARPAPPMLAWPAITAAAGPLVAGRHPLLGAYNPSVLASARWCAPPQGAALTGMPAAAPAAMGGATPAVVSTELLSGRQTGGAGAAAAGVGGDRATERKSSQLKVGPSAEEGVRKGSRQVEGEGRKRGASPLACQQPPKRARSGSRSPTSRRQGRRRSHSPTSGQQGSRRSHSPTHGRKGSRRSRSSSRRRQGGRRSRSPARQMHDGRSHSPTRGRQGSRRSRSPGHELRGMRRSRSAARQLPGKDSRSPARRLPGMRSRSPARRLPGGRSRSPARWLPGGRSRSAARRLPGGRSRSPARRLAGGRSRSPARRLAGGRSRSPACGRQGSRRSCSPPNGAGRSRPVPSSPAARKAHGGGHRSSSQPARGDRDGSRRSVTRERRHISARRLTGSRGLHDSAAKSKTGMNKPAPGPGIPAAELAQLASRGTAKEAPAQPSRNGTPDLAEVGCEHQLKPDVSPYYKPALPPAGAAPPRPAAAGGGSSRGRSATSDAVAPGGSSRGRSATPDAVRGDRGRSATPDAAAAGGGRRRSATPDAAVVSLQLGRSPTPDVADFLFKEQHQPDAATGAAGVEVDNGWQPPGQQAPVEGQRQEGQASDGSSMQISQHTGRTGQGAGSSRDAVSLAAGTGGAAVSEGQPRVSSASPPLPPQLPSHSPPSSPMPPLPPPPDSAAPPPPCQQSNRTADSSPSPPPPAPPSQPSRSSLPEPPSRRDAAGSPSLPPGFGQPALGAAAMHRPGPGSTGQCRPQFEPSSRPSSGAGWAPRLPPAYADLPPWLFHLFMDACHKLAWERGLPLADGEVLEAMDQLAGEPVCLRSLDMSLYRLCLLMEDIGAVALRPTPQRAYITELLM